MRVQHVVVVFFAVIAAGCAHDDKHDQPRPAASPTSMSARAPATKPAHPHPNAGETWYVQDHAYTPEVYEDVVHGDGPGAYPAQTSGDKPDRSFHFAYPFPCRVKSEGDSGFFECAVDGRGMISNQTVWTNRLMTKREAESVSPGFGQATAYFSKPKPKNTPSDEPLPVTVVPAERAKARALLARAAALYEQAQSIVSNTPSNLDEASALAAPDGAAGVFYARERSYQNDVEQPGSLGRAAKATDAYYALSNLVQLDSFLFGAVQASVASCNRHDALLNLKVVEANIAEARKDLAGHITDDYEPPDITNSVDGASHCGG